MPESAADIGIDDPIAMNGVEFVEYAAADGAAFGNLLEAMGFVRIGRHRSRAVTLYRQGAMNVIVNASGTFALDGDAPQIAAVAFRVADAGAAWKRAVDLGAWEAPVRVSAMELNIPGIRGAGPTLLYFVDREETFSIYDVDFVLDRNIDDDPPAIAGLHFFGVVQSVFEGRTPEWIDFYRELLGFRVLPQGEFFGILPKGTLLESARGRFFVQLIEPPGSEYMLEWDERLLRIGLGAPDVPAAVAALQARGIAFIDRGELHSSDKGALTEFYLGGVAFELVASSAQSAS